MDAHANRAVVESLYRDGWGGGNLDVVDAVFAPEHVVHWNELQPSDQRRTCAEVKAIMAGYRAAFPDLVVTVDEMLAEGDRVAVQVTFAGTHLRTYEGFAPTYRESRFTDMQILRLRDGKIVEATLGSGGLARFFAILSGEAFAEAR
jgi:predicted ester cyclase